MLSFGLFLCVTLASMMTLIQGQEGQEDNKEKQNPYLVQQRQNRRQQEHKMALKQLQEAHMSINLQEQPPPASRTNQQRRNENNDRPTPTTSTPSPTQSQKSEWGGGHHGGGGKEEGGYNRNEMHGDWTPSRWKNQPKQKSSLTQGPRHHSATESCGGRAYSPREHICCQGSIQKRQGLRPACCGQMAFDFVFSLCCKGKVQVRANGQADC